MKTNLTTKQIKKIQNGKLAIYKDIDTADAREYLLNVLEWLFPNDKDAKKQRAVEVGLYFYAFCDTTWCHNEKVELKAINLSQIMYTYNTEQFKPISKPCTEEQWSNDLKPVVEAFGIDCECCSDWSEEFNFLQNNYCGNHKCIIGNFNEGTKTINHYSPTEFLEACGIVRVDKEFEQTYTITTDQIKTARTNPETLEELFPKAFEKPVFAVGKWYVFEEYSKRIVKFVEKENLSNYSGYGFNANNEFSNRNFCSKQVNFKITEATLSDLQPLFEAEFNKRYKEGDLLECAYNKKDKSKFDKNGITNFYLDNQGFNAYHNGVCLFIHGNFAKVIKSAELIKAEEEELEQAKKRVESLKNR